MDSTTKTVLIVGGIAVAAGVGYWIYTKNKTATAVKQTTAAAAANPLSASGIQGYITGASGVLTALGNAFGAHTGTNAQPATGGGAAGVSNLVHVGTNTTTTGKIDLSGGSDQSTGQYAGEGGGSDSGDDGGDEYN